MKIFSFLSIFLSPVKIKGRKAFLLRNIARKHYFLLSFIILLPGHHHLTHKRHKKDTKIKNHTRTFSTLVF